MRIFPALALILFSIPAFASVELAKVVSIPSDSSAVVRVVFELQVAGVQHNLAQFRLETVSLNGIAASTSRLPFYFGRFDLNDSLLLSFDFPAGEIGPGNTGSLKVTGRYSALAVPRTYDVSHSVNLKTPSSFGTATAKFFDPEYLPDGEVRKKPLSDGGDVTVRLNEIEVGKLDRDGAITLHLAPGRYELDAAVKHSTDGIHPDNQTFEVVAGQDRHLEFVFHQGGESGDPGRLESPQGQNGILDVTLKEFELKFSHNGVVPRLGSFSGIDMETEEPREFVYLSKFFEISADGNIIATDIEAFRRAFAGRRGKLTLQVSADGAEGRSYEGSFSFYSGEYLLKGRLQAPPSAPGLAVGGLKVSLWTLEGHLGLEAITNPDGSFEFKTRIPRVPILLKAETSASGQHFYANATLLMSGDQSVSIPLLQAKDQVNH